MRSVKPSSVVQWATISLLLISTLFASTASAQLIDQITATNTICGGDIGDYKGCTAGEISLATISGTVWAEPQQSTQACVLGETITALVSTVSYEINTQNRYDLLMWIGEQEGTDPRDAAAGDPNSSCIVMSIPGPFNGTVFQGLETGNNADQCGDINGGNAAAQETREFSNVSFECQDNDGDGKADVQVLLSWSQNQNQLCGTATGQSFPTAGAGSKCDFELVNSTLDVLEPASLTLIKNTVGGDDTFEFATTGGLTGTSITTSGGTGSFTYSLLRPIADLDIFETLLPNSVWDATDITCTGATNNGTFIDNPQLPSIQGIVIDEGQDVVCTVSNTKLASLTVVKNTSGGNGAFGFEGNNGIGLFTLDTGETNTAQRTFSNLQPGTDYSLQEAIPNDWNLASASCSTGGETAALDTGLVTGITLPAGGDVTCTFNNAKPGLSTFTKISVGALGTFDFTITNASVAGFSLETAGSPTGGSSTPKGIVLDVGQYVITENDPSGDGWTLTDIQCTEDGDQDSIIDIPNRQITLNVQAGETIACDVTNTKNGTVIVEKQTLPAGDSATFDFTGTNSTTPSGTGTLDGTLSDNETLTLSDNFSVAATSNETVTAGWDLTDITCTGGTDASTIAIGGTASFTPGDTDIAVLPAPGETITCVFTNTKAAQLTVVKHITATGPLNQEFSFTSTILGFETFTLEPVDELTDDEIVISGLTPGIYGVGEDPPGADGWALTGASCGDGSLVTAIDLSPGEELTCTFTNSPLGSATVIKNTVGGDDTFAFVGDDPIGSFDLDTSTGPGTASADFTNVLEAGTYDVVETPLPAGWQLTAVDCVDDGTNNSSGDLGTATGTIDVDLGETVTCTFENTADAQLVVEKVTIPDTDTTEFTFSSEVLNQFWDGTGTATTLLAHGESDSITDQPKTQVVSEAPVPGYVITDIACTGMTNSIVEYLPSQTNDFVDGDTTVLVATAAGEVVTCAFTNTKEGSLTIVKETVGDDGSFTFNHDVQGVASPFVINTAVDDTNVISTTLLPGSYMVSEVVPTNWDLSNIACSGATDSTITIGAAGMFDPGDTGVTVDLLNGDDIVCTFTNTVITKQVTLQKAWVGGVNGDTAELTASGLSGPQTNTSTASGGDETDTVNTAVLTARAGETINLMEVLGGGNIGNYTSGIACTGSTNQPVELNATTSTLLIDEADSPITCTYTNTVRAAQLTLQKAWVGGVLNDTADLTVMGALGTDSATSTATGGDQTDTTNTAVLTVLVGEEVMLDELLGPGNSGEYNASFTCSGAANSPNYTVGATTATLIIDAADTAITCTYTNSVKVSGLTLQKSWIGGVANDTADLEILATNGPATNTSTATGGDQTDLVNTAFLATALAGETVTFNEDLSGNTGAYTTGFNCLGSSNAPSYTPGDTTATLLIDEGDTSITCTFTNTIMTAELNLQKEWVGGVINDTSGLTIEGVNGPATSTSVATGGDQIDMVNVAVLTARVGEIVTLTELLGGVGDYATGLVCTGANNTPTYTAGDTSATLLIDAADTAITCTYTNTINTAQITLQKAWVDGVLDDTAALTAEGTLSTESATSTATGGDQTDTTNTAVLTALVGETVTLSEILGGLADYTAGFACTGATNAPTYTAGESSATLVIDAADIAIVCTYTNTRVDPAINLAKTVNGPATLEADGTYTVVYTVTASNTGGYGTYDVLDTFSPGSGITLTAGTPPVAVYQAGTEDSQTGTPGAYPNFVTGESLASGLNESWIVTANFTIDPASLDPATSSCDPTTPVINTGFYNYVEGSVTDTDLTDNEACTGLEDPGINLAKTVNGPAVLEADGTYTVIYTITATNTSGPGSYDLVDAFLPGVGITLNTADAVYLAGTEDSQTGTLGAYPNFVTDEGLGAGLDESWTVTANFTIDLSQVTVEGANCDTSDAGANNTGFNNSVTGSDSDTDLTDNEACTELVLPTLTLVKAIDGGDALPADFALTLTAADGVNDAGVDYVSGDSILARAGVAYTLSEAADQVEDYFENGIVCVDDASGLDVGHPVTLTEDQSVTCTLTNTLNEIIFEVLAEVCIDNAPLVNYDVTTTLGVSNDVAITWIKNDGSDEVVESLTGQAASGQLLWPGAAIVDGVAVAWPGWSCDAQGQNCVQIDDGLVPSMQLKFDINPTSTVIVDYPPATVACGPQAPLPELLPVPVNNPLALLLLTLMMLASGWYFRPAVMRKF